MTHDFYTQNITVIDQAIHPSLPPTLPFANWCLSARGIAVYYVRAVNVKYDSSTKLVAQSCSQRCLYKMTGDVTISLKKRAKEFLPWRDNGGYRNFI